MATIFNEMETNGWYIKVGQIYSNPYDYYHIKIVLITKDNEKDDTSDVWIHYMKLEPDNYEQIGSSEIERFRLWHLNEVWDLEIDVTTAKYQLV